MKDKLNRYFTRTIEHIHRVQENMLYLVINYEGYSFSDGPTSINLDEETCRQLIWNVMNHDRSKFSENQFLPYIELTEYYHQRRVLKNASYQYPPLIEQEIEDAINDHYQAENHHPERNKGVAAKMSYVDLIEVVCDLQAMAQEFNEGSCRGYFENVWVKKQSENFYDDYDWEVSKTFMREIISLFESGGV